MNQIYVYDGPFEKGEQGYGLIREGAARYGVEQGYEYDFYGGEISKTEKGKPFFVDSPVSFSLTHSRAMWMCLFSDKPCGLDLQEIKDCDYEKLASRWFTRQEQHYVELWGLDGFFDVWVRKEAFAKCTGLGLFSNLPPVVDEKTDLAEEIIYDNVTYYFTTIDISPQMKCAVSMTEKDGIELRILG